MTVVDALPMRQHVLQAQSQRHVISMSGQPLIEISADQTAPPPAALPCRIDEATDADAADWDAFLERTPGANFYQTYAWRLINREQFGHDTRYLVARAAAGQGIRGVLPLVLLKSRLFGNILCSMPFVNFGGPCAVSLDISRALLARAAALTCELDADYAELRVLEPLGDDLPTTRHKVSMTIDLEADAERVWQAFTTKHRTNIRRVYKNAIEVRHGRHELLEDFYRLLSLSWRRLGTPIYRKTYFADILARFPEATRIFVAYRHDVPVAAAFNGYFGDTVEGMWAGTSPENQKLQPNYVLYWEMIKHACEHGYRHFHLGRSTVDSNAEHFKKKWNAHAQQLYWQYILHGRDTAPELNASNPKFRLAIALWKKLPLPATQWLGPWLARSIP